MGCHSAQGVTFLPCRPQHLPHLMQTNRPQVHRPEVAAETFLLWSRSKEEDYGEGQRGHAVRQRTARQCCLLMSLLLA